jgi:hypothetical protein
VHRIQQLVWLIIVTSTVLPATSACANTFNNNDVQLLINLGHQATALRRDLVETQKALMYQQQTYECIEMIFHDLERVDIISDDVSDLVSLSVLMNDSVDETAVNKYLYARIKYALANLDSARRGINLSMSHCSTNAVVSIKGQRVLDFYSSIEYALRQIGRRLGL